MKRVLRWCMRAATVLLLLLFAAVLCRNPLLEAFSEYRLHDATGLSAEIDRLRASVGFSTTTVEGFRIRNPEAFGPAPLLVAPRIHMVLDAGPMTSGKIRFKEAHVYLAEFNIVRAPDGRLNLDDVEHMVRERLRKRKKTRWMEVDFGGIDRLYVTLGTLNFLDARQPEHNRTIHLGVTNELVTTIQTEDDFHAWVASFVLRLALQEYFSRPGGPKQKALDLLLDGLTRDQ